MDEETKDPQPESLIIVPDMKDVSELMSAPVRFNFTYGWEILEGPTEVKND